MTEVQAFATDIAAAARLATALGVGCRKVELHRFPDGEIMPVAPDDSAGRVIVYVPLDHPNEKLLALLLAADAWRRLGVKRLVLAAPYLCYMRQDKAFQPGQPLSRDVICALLAARFDRVVTVDAHLHRTLNLSEVFGAVPAQDLSAAEPLARALSEGAGAEGATGQMLVVGPDEESRPWVQRIASLMGADVMMFSKVRRGDCEIDLSTDDIASAAGRPVVIVDDICSSGTTLARVAALLREAGAAQITAGVVHALFDSEVAARLKAAGVSTIISTDSITHPTNAAPLADLLAGALRDEVAS